MTAEPEADEDRPLDVEAFLDEVVASSRDQAIRTIRNVRRGLTAFVASIATPVCLAQALGRQQDILAGLPDDLDLGIISILLILETIAIVAHVAMPAVIVGRLDREMDKQDVRPATRKNDLAAQQVAFYYLSCLILMLRSVCSSLGLVAAGLILGLTYRPWAWANFAAILAGMVLGCPTSSRMERWVRRMAAARIESAPPPDFLD